MKKLVLSLFIALGTQLVLAQQKFDAGYQHSMMVCSDSTVWFWGYFKQANTPTPQQIVGLNNVKSVCMSSFKWYALKYDGTVWAVQADGSFIQFPGIMDIKEIALGDGDHCLLLKNDGTVLAFGENGSGQLGDGTTIDKSNPQQVPGLTSVISIAAGYGHSLAVKSDGTVRAWGKNNKGQLGDGTTVDKTSPIQISGLTGVSRVGAGGANNSGHSVALNSDGTVWAWGANGSGQLADGTTTDRGTPAQIAGLTGVVSISVGKNHNMVVKNDNTLWGWGSNSLGQINGTLTAGPKIPTQISGITNVVAVAAGDEHTIALRADGMMFGCGWNQMGQVGNGVTGLYSAIDTVMSTCTPGGTTAINSIDDETLELAIYPNPNNGLFTITLPTNTATAALQITNVLGEVVWNKSIPEVNNTIDISNLADGLYIAKTRIGNRISIEKFIKQ